MVKLWNWLLSGLYALSSYPRNPMSNQMPLLDWSLTLTRFRCSINAAELNRILFIYFIFGCIGSSLLHTGFSLVAVSGATLCCGVQASHFGGFSCCGARILGVRASVVVAHGL